MQERLEVVFFPKVKAQDGSLRRLIDKWSSRSFVVEPKWGGYLRLLTPVNDDSWKADILDSVRNGLIDSDWHADRVEQLYTEQEIRFAPLFSLIHVGYDIKVPIGRDTGHVTGVSHIADVDTTQACAGCGVGTRQNGPLRILAGELNKAGEFASLTIGSNSFYMLTERFADELAKERGEALPLREVETHGKHTARQRWFQIMPEYVVPEEAVRPMRQVPISCPKCGTSRWSPVEPYGSYEVISEQAMSGLEFPPATLSPLWEGELSRFADGRVIDYPERTLWLRGDFARTLATKKVKGLERALGRGLDLKPIIFAQCV